MKRKEVDTVAPWIYGSDESDVETNEPKQKKRKLNELDDALNVNYNNDEDELLKDIPFTNQELEKEYDEEAFMDKLSKHLQEKHDDSDINVEHKEISALDILTMDEEELNKIMPINDDKVNNNQITNHGFRYIPTFKKKRTDNYKKRRTQYKYKRSKSVKYSEVPELYKSHNKKSLKNPSIKNPRNSNKSMKKHKKSKKITKNQ
eukprot:UN07570